MTPLPVRFWAEEATSCCLLIHGVCGAGSFRRGEFAPHLQIRRRPSRQNRIDNTLRFSLSESPVIAKQVRVSTNSQERGILSDAPASFENRGFQTRQASESIREVSMLPGRIRSVNKFCKRKFYGCFRHLAAAKFGVALVRFCHLTLVCARAEGY